MSAKNKANEIYITRIYDAPVKMVWDAWTDPQQVAQWWGPRGFTITTHSKDLRPGGSWVYTMHGPDGVDYPNRTHYYEVEKYSRLVYDHGANETQPPLFQVTVVFSEVKQKTKMEMTMTLKTPEAAKEIKKFIKQASGNSTWDRLGEYLNKNSTQQETFVINRSFHAPIDVVYDMWTKPEHFSQWLAPTGFTMSFLRAEIKVGSSTFCKMTDGKSITMYSRAQYLELQKPNRIVYTQQFVDENENISRHPMAPTWPETMLTVVQLTEEENDHTRITITWAPYEGTLPEELAVFVSARAGMTMGWTGSFDKLEDLLASKGFSPQD